MKPRRIPVIGDGGDIEPVQHDPEYRHDRTRTDGSEIPLPVANHEQDTGNGDKSNFFDKIPGSPGSIDPGNALAMQEYQDGHAEIDKEGDRTNMGEPQYDIPVGTLVPEGHIILKDPLVDGFHDDHQGKTGEDARDKKENGDELRIKEGMDLWFSH